VVSTGFVARVAAGAVLLTGTLACTSLPWQGDDPSSTPHAIVDDPAPIVRLRAELAAAPGAYTATYQVLTLGQEVGSGPRVTVARSAGAVSTTFLSLPRVLELLDAAATVKAEVDATSYILHGEEMPCVRTISTESHPAPRLFDVTPFSALTVCRTAAGVLGLMTAFRPGHPNGTPTDIQQLERYDPAVDPAAFTAPSGATVRNVDRIDPTV
jgi:hypothetical protein